MENIASQKVLSPLLTGLLLMISLTLFAFEAHEQVYKFSVGKTTTAVEKKHYDALQLPEITICMEYGFKKEALEREGLPERFFLTADSNYGNNGTDPFPDIMETWEKATYSDRELEITWRLYDGKNMQTMKYPTPKIKHSPSFSEKMSENVTLIGFNTVYEGRCYKWSMPGIEVSNKDRVLKDIYVNLAGNDSNCIAYIHPPASHLLAAVNRGAIQ